MLNIVLKLVGSKFGSVAGLVLLIVIIIVGRSVIFHGAGDPWWWVLIGLLIVGWIGWLIWDNHQSKQKSSAIAGNLVDSAQSQEASARPDRRTAYKRDRENLEYTIQLLNKSHSAGDAKGSALYYLPWIMVVGPPADGKTTAIENAGIRWPQDPRMDEATGEARREMRIHGAGGTRSCNWFFSSDAIILDTAGRFQAREQGQADEEEWLQFLKMLQKQRPKRPINGVLALCSVERALGDPAVAKEAAQKMRRQINEIMENLQTHVPVYLVVNKCDLIHGFVEYFQDLNQEERKQIWGFTRPYAPRKKKSGDGLESDRDAIMADFDREFDRIIDVLETRRLNRLIDPQLFSSERAALCIFPSEFRELREPLREFISNVFYENPYGHNPMLRGIYFTSATQMEGNPIVQLMKQVAGEYDIPMDALPFKSRQTVDTYFLHDLMTSQVFTDTNLGGRFKTSLFDRTRILLAAALGVATILVGIWMGTSYAVNKGKNSHLYSVTTSVDSLSSHSVRAGSVEALDRLDDLRTGLEDYQSKGIFGLFYWAFGRSKASDLAKAANWRLGTTAEKLFIEEAWHDADRTLSSLGAASNNLDHYISSYKTYVFLSQAEGHQYVDSSVIAAHIMNNQFGDLNKGEDRAEYERKLGAILSYYDKLDDRHEFTAEPRRIETAKRNISDYWDWDRLMDDIVDRLATGDPGFSATDISEAFVSNDTVPFNYTFLGYDQLVGNELNREMDLIRKDQLLKEIIGSKLAASSGNPLVEAYENKVIQVWTDFFGEVSIKSSREALKDISGSRSSLESLLLAAANNTQFSSERMRDAFADLHRFTDRVPAGGFLDSTMTGGGKNESDNSKILPDYMKAVEDAAGAGLDAGGGSGACADSYSDAVKAIKESGTSTFRFSNSRFSRSFESFLDKPFEVAKQVAASNLLRCLNDKWNKEVYSYFKDDFVKFYPFDQRGSEVAMAKIRDFFSFSGPLKSFVVDEQRKAKGLVRFGSRFESAVSQGDKINQNIGDNCQAGIEFYPGMDTGGDLEEVQVLRGGELFFTYDNGPSETLNLSIPWTWSDLELVIRTSSGTGSVKFTGEWAPLKLLDALEIHGNEGTLVVRDGSSRQITKLRFRIDASSPGVKLYRVFNNFKIPPAVDQ